MSDSIPCENCIVFAQCKSRYIYVFGGNNHLNIVNMYIECCLFRGWYIGTYFSDYIIHKLYGVSFHGEKPAKEKVSM